MLEDTLTTFMGQLERPIAESYWVIPGRFLAGEYPAAPYFEEHSRRRMDAFLESGFDTFIDLTREGELQPYEPILYEQAERYGIQVEYRRFSIGDFGLPTPREMKEILDTIDAALRTNHKIYLHCWGGVGRTGTAVGCYLARHGLSGDQALDQVAAWWHNVPKHHQHPNSPETAVQAAFVRHWFQ